MTKQEKRFTLMAQFNWMFAIFIVAAMILAGIVSYLNQTKFYHAEVERNLRNVAGYLNTLITAQGDDFSKLKEYFVAHKEELRIPYDFDGDYAPAKADFERLWSTRYPGMATEDVSLEDMEPDVRRAYGLYLYEYWLYQIERARGDFGLIYSYFIFPVPDKENTMCYMYDGFRDKEILDGEEYIFLGAEAAEDPSIHTHMWAAWNTGLKPNGLDVMDNEYGHVYAYSEPVSVNGVQVGLVCAEVLVESVNETIRSMTLMLVVLLFLVLSSSSLGMLWFIRASVLRRVDRLVEQVVEYSRDKSPILAETMEKEVLDSPHRDEITTLSERFIQMIRELKNYMENLQAVTAERERIATELNVATDIQASMLPSIFPAFPEREEFDLFASMSPAKEVGGDFYDFFMVDENHLAVVIADVSGKGVPAALFMVIAKTLIKNHAQAGKKPDAALRDANNQLCDGNGGDLFVTAWLGVLDIRTGELSFTDAGHETPLILRASGQLEELKPRKKRPPLAIMEDLPYAANRTVLGEGDMLFLYTDGVPEATNGENVLYGMERLEALLRLHTKDEPKELLAAVRKDVDLFVADAPQFDDLTMLGLKIRRIEGADGGHEESGNES